MGGDCSQKAHAPEQDSTPLRGAVSVRLSAKPRLYRNAAIQPRQVVVYSFSPAGPVWKTAGEAEAGSGGDQPAKE